MSTPFRLALVGALLVACAPDAPAVPAADVPLPSFAPMDTAPGTSSSVAPAPDDPSGPPSDVATTGAAAPPATQGSASPSQPATDAPATPARDAGTPSVRYGSIGDATGDVRAGTPLQDPPGWVDLVRLELTRDSDGYEVRVELAAPAPARREDERVTNIATFYDVDGDGELDYQVYATSTPDGWGSAYFDHVAGESRYADDDAVDVTVEDGAVVIRFPLAHLGDATSLQWSAATQWGTFEELQTGTDARDRATDDGHGTPWPGPG